MNKYKTSDGETLTKAQIDRRIRAAKEAYLEQFLDINGFYFCERTGRSDLKPLDISHIISVKYAQETGRAELAYSYDNLELLSRQAHNFIEAMTNQAREEWYNMKREGFSFNEFKILTNE